MTLPENERILMISTHGYVAAEPKLGKPDTGGQVVYVLELSKSLARLGYEVDILTRQFEDQPSVEEVGERVRLLRFPCSGKEFIGKETLCEHIPEWVDNVSAYLKEQDAHYAFINSHYWDAAIAGQALADRHGIPHLHTPHSIGSWKRDNMDGDPVENEKKYNFKHRIAEERRVYHACDTVIATTPRQQEILTNGDYGIPVQKIQVIPPGYDDQRFFPVSPASRNAIKQELGLEGTIVLALGRMAKNKGYDLLIRSMPPVFKRIPDAKLLLAIGASDPTPAEKVQLDEFREIARELDIEDRIIFGDYIPDEQLANYYRAADVFALCSRYEPFGMTAVEAMACGTPTIITTEGGLWDQVTWGLEALYANPFDPEAYGHAIAMILSQPRVAAQLEQYGSSKARGSFTWTGIAQQVLGVLTGRSQEKEPVNPLPDFNLDPSTTIAPAQKNWQPEITIEEALAEADEGDETWKAEACS